MIPAVAARLVSTPLGRAALAGLGLLMVASLALSPSGVAPVAARGSLAAGAVVAVAILLRRRVRAGAPAALVVLDRAPLAPGAGIAIVQAGDRRLLVGFGRDGVRLVANLGSGEGRGEP